MLARSTEAATAAIVAASSALAPTTFGRLACGVVGAGGGVLVDRGPEALEKLLTKLGADNPGEIPERLVENLHVACSLPTMPVRHLYRGQRATILPRALFADRRVWVNTRCILPI